MTKVVVIGATGLLGSHIVSALEDHGHSVKAVSRDSGVNTLTGEGLANAFEEADAVVDASNSPLFEDDAVMQFFTAATKNVLEAEKAAGVAHHVALSIVGADRLPDSGYLRAKVAQEKVIVDSGQPYTIVRSTQFFEFAKSIADSATVGQEIRLPHGLVQPIAASDAAGDVARTAVGAPLNGVREVAGPETFGLDDFVRTGLAAHHDPRTVVTDREARYFGTELNSDSLVAGPDAWLAPTRFEDWLQVSGAKR